MAATRKRATSKPTPPPPTHKPKDHYRQFAAETFVADAEAAAEHIPQALALIMKARGITQPQLATWMGLSHAALRHRLYGRSDFRAQEIVALAKMFDVPTDALLDPSFPLGEIIRRPVPSGR